MFEIKSTSLSYKIVKKDPKNIPNDNNINIIYKFITTEKNDTQIPLKQKIYVYSFITKEKY